MPFSSDTCSQNGFLSLLITASLNNGHSYLLQQDNYQLISKHDFHTDNRFDMVVKEIEEFKTIRPIFTKNIGNVVQTLKLAIEDIVKLEFENNKSANFVKRLFSKQHFYCAAKKQYPILEYLPSFLPAYKSEFLPKLAHVLQSKEFVLCKEFQVDKLNKSIANLFLQFISDNVNKHATQLKNDLFADFLRTNDRKSIFNLFPSIDTKLMANLLLHLKKNVESIDFDRVTNDDFESEMMLDYVSETLNFDVMPLISSFAKRNLVRISIEKYLNATLKERVNLDINTYRSRISSIIDVSVNQAIENLLHDLTAQIQSGSWLIDLFEFQVENQLNLLTANFQLTKPSGEFHKGDYNEENPSESLNIDPYVWRKIDEDENSWRQASNCQLSNAVLARISSEVKNASNEILGKNKRN